MPLARHFKGHNLGKIYQKGTPLQKTYFWSVFYYRNCNHRTRTRRPTDNHTTLYLLAFLPKLLYFPSPPHHTDSRNEFYFSRREFRMKKQLLTTIAASIFLTGSMAQAVMQSRIYIVNQTGDTFYRGPVMRQVGQKYAPRLRKKRGAPKKLEGFTCKAGVCKETARRVFWRTKPEKISTRPQKIESSNNPVGVAAIRRNQELVGLQSWKNQPLPGGFVNPNPAKFKEIKRGYKVFPFEDIGIPLRGPQGDIALLVSSERVGLSALAYSDSILEGSIGGAIVKT